MEKDAPPCLNLLTKKAPYKGLGADSEEKHEPVSDIDTATVDSLKVLDPNRPIREADMSCWESQNGNYGISGQSDSASLRLYARELHYFRPLLGLVRDELAEVGGRTRKRGAA